MIKEGDIVLFRFPQTDLEKGKLRPAVLLKKIPNDFDDWLVCMVSTQLHQKVEGIEVVISESDHEFSKTGLKKDSLIRTTRIAVVDDSIFVGKLGSLPQSTYSTIKQKFASWISE